MKRWRSVRNWISRSRFSVIVTSIASLAVITTLFLLSYIISTKAERVVVEAFSEEGLGMVRGASRRVEHLFKGINSELEQLSMLRELQVPDDIQGSGIMEVTYQGMMNYVSCLRRLDKKGDLIIGYQGDCELIEEAASEFNKGYFQKTMRENMLTVSKAFINEEGKRRIRITYPIFREGKGGESIFDGVLSAVVKVDAIYSLMVSPFKAIVEEGMRFILYSSEGEIFSFPTHSDIEGKNIFNDLEYCGGCHTVPEEFILLSQRGEGWDVVDNFSDKKVVTLYQPVELPDKSLLIVGLYADYNNVVKEGREISKYAVLVAAFSVLIVMVGSVIALTLLKVRDEAERREKAIERERELMRRVKESEERYRDLFENANDLIQIIKPDGRLIYVNHAWMETIGYNEDEISDLSIFDIVHPNDIEQFRESFQLILGGEQIEKIEADFVTKNKRIITVEGNLNCRFEKGKPIMVRGIFHDITERIKIDRMKDEFISTVSHELRTPLTSIHGSLNVMSTGIAGQLPEKVQYLIDIAARNSERLKNLVNDLLDFQKIEFGKMVFNIEPIQLSHLIKRAIEDNKAYSQQFSVDFVLDEHSPDIRVDADYDRLMQVMSNLLSNATKFSPPNSTVEIAVLHDNGNVRVTVRDHGPGVPVEFRDQIFDKFTQADSSSTRQRGGTGLGLSIAKSIVERLGGTIGFETEIDVGTTFYFDLPTSSDE